MAKRKDKDDQANENLNDSNSGEDNFGLPDIEYKPLDTQQDQASSTTRTEETTTSETYTYTPEEDEPSSNAPVVISILIGVVVVVGSFLVYQYWYKPKAEKERMELEALKKKEAAYKQARLDAEAAAEKRRKEIADSTALANAKPVIGTIETLSARTRGYYVVIASAVDGDLIMDYAKKLSVKGVSTKIIPPFGKWKFYRLTISDYDTFDAAQTSADAAKPEFGQGAWVIRY